MGLFWYKQIYQICRHEVTYPDSQTSEKAKSEVANDLGRLKTCPEEIQVTWKFLQTLFDRKRNEYLIVV